jgi:hypothetical protein
MGRLTEGDEILIAEGIGIVHNESMGPVYRYGPQVGYYRLVLLLTEALGDLARAPAIMVLLSVVAGTVIPTLGLFAFPSDLGRAERWLLALALAVNPAIWESSAYGNTAMPSVALACCALVVLSRRPSRLGEGIALALFGVAILVRADAVLATGALGLLLWRNHGRLRPAVVRVAALGLTMAAVYAVLIFADPLMRGFLATVTKHLTNNFQTQFWDFLLWSMSPIPLALAVIGLRELEPRRRWLLATIAAWCIPVFAFYFASTTTPRYHLLVVLPLSVASVVGLVGVARMFTRAPRVAYAALVALAFAHAFVAVGRFTPGRSRSWLSEGSIGTHDGAFSTGAFLYKAYRWRRPELDRIAALRYSVPPAGDGWLRELAAGRHSGGEVLVVADGVYAPLLHWLVELRGLRIAQYLADNTSDCWQFKFDAYGARVTMTDFTRLKENPRCRLAARPADEVWIVKPESADGPERLLARLPAGLALASVSADSSTQLARYVVGSSP